MLRYRFRSPECKRLRFLAEAKVVRASAWLDLSRKPSNEYAPLETILTAKLTE